MTRVRIIAEAGVNHNGSLRLARRLVVAAARAGADMVKFQTFRAEQLVIPDAPQAAYQRRNTRRKESQLEMLQRLELNLAAHRNLKTLCALRRIAFLSTAFDLPSVELLVRLHLSCWKIPSGEITNVPLLRRIGTLHQKVILSTGMATLKEIERALEVLIRAGTRLGDITVLHCTSEYPALYAEVNLRAMLTIQRKFGVAVGYSDHTRGVEIALAAVALGASIIEKHFTLDRNLPGPDHKASLEPDELRQMVTSIRHIELAMGDGRKCPTPAELKTRLVARKSIVAAKRIHTGEILTVDNITVKRPGSGVSAAEWDDMMGSRATRDYAPDDLIER